MKSEMTKTLITITLNTGKKILATLEDSILLPGGYIQVTTFGAKMKIKEDTIFNVDIATQH